MTARIYGTLYECDRATRGADWVRLHLNGEVILHDSGISDFSGYVLNGEWEVAQPAEDQITQMKQQIERQQAIIDEMIGSANFDAN